MVGNAKGQIKYSLFSWNSYKINQAQDKIGIFVSIVSTKIPFKGTGKEYIGDDISEIASAVKVAFSQLRYIIHKSFPVLTTLLFPDSNSAVLHSAEIQNCKKNTSSRAAGEKA